MLSKLIKKSLHQYERHDNEVVITPPAFIWQAFHYERKHYSLRVAFHNLWYMLRN